MSFKIFEKKELEYKSVHVPFHSKIEDSVIFWKEIIDLKKITSLTYQVSGIKEDLEVFIPLIIKNNPELNTIDIHFLDLNMNFDFDKQPLTDSLKNRALNNVSVCNDDYKRSFIPSLLIENLLECFQFACIKDLTLHNYFITTKNMEFLSMIKFFDEITISKCNFDKNAEFNYSFNIKSLIFNEMILESEIGVYNLIKSTNGLKELSLGETEFSIDFKAIKDSLKGQHLKTFFACEMFENLEEFVDVVKKVSDSLNLAFTKDSPLYNYPLFKDLKSNTTIQDLDLNESLNNFEGVDEFLTKNNTLKNLGFESISSENIELISKGLSNNYNLKYLNIRKTNLKDQMSNLMKSLLYGNLEELYIYGCKVDDSSCDLIGLYLSTNFRLKELNLNSNDINDEGLVKILHGLKNNNTLKTLSLFYNNFGNEGCLALKEFLKLNTSLKDLNVGNCKYDIKGLKLIYEGLQYNTKLKSLTLSNITNQNLKNQGLEILFFNTGLHYCNIGGSDFITNRNKKMIEVLSIRKEPFLNLQFMFE